MMTVGGTLANRSRLASPPSISTSSSLTILMTCCAGLSACMTSAPSARSLTLAMKVRTTGSATSASSSAILISRQVASMSAADSRPRPRKDEKTWVSRSESVSNTCGELLRAAIRCAGCPPLSEHGVDKRQRLERRQVVRALAQPDQLDRHAELPLHGDHDAALGGAVQLRQDDPGDVDDLGEHPGLTQAILARRRVEHEQHLVDRAVLLDNPLDLAELVHQPGLGVQAARGVHDNGVHAARHARTDRLERDARRIGALAVRSHHGRADPGSPGF